MGSDMNLDQPITSGSRTYGCADTVMADDEASKLYCLVKDQNLLYIKQIRQLSIVSTTKICSEGQWYQYQSPKNRKLVCDLHKGVNKYIDRHCKRKHTRTNQLRKHMYIALQAALLEVDVDEIMLPEESSDEIQTSEVGENDVRQIIDSMIYMDDIIGFQQDYLISPAVARRILDGVNYLIPSIVMRRLTSLGIALKKH